MGFYLILKGASPPAQENFGNLSFPIIFKESQNFWHLPSENLQNILASHSQEAWKGDRFNKMSRYSDSQKLSLKI